MEKFEDHVGLVNRLAITFTQRLKKAGIVSYEFEDMVSEMTIAFMRAQKAFDPEKARFSTFFWRVATNHYNQLASNLLAEQYGGKSTLIDDTRESDDTDSKAIDLEDHTRHYGLRYISMSQLKSEEGGEVEFADPGTFAQPGDALEARQRIAQIARNPRLSKITKLYLRTVIDLSGNSVVSPAVREEMLSSSRLIRIEIEREFGVKLERLDINK